MMNAHLNIYFEYLRRASWSMTRVVVENDGDGVSLSVEAASPGEGVVLRLRFSGVTGLRLQQSEGFSLDLQIIDMTSDGWEGLRYKVTDPEHDILAFWCEDVQIDAL
ncbi:hypothetical protein IOD16_14700 [Saccharothrix sp. 6-C]|uniref:hypothetical protein n=1 Tax=Saccharothrix sp. 6-C TaxID=2781735 RepID=UPI001916FEBE|nr:hypothetical protein [Saccharothrix sp. 6-C]QQQ79534.1 hypothetical protein IOD16_14700 [Saccharothrix sp. 6-C]